MCGDLHLAAVEIIFSSHALRVVCDTRGAIVVGFGNGAFFGDHLGHRLTGLRHLLFGHQRRFTVEVRVGKETRRRAGIVQNAEVVLAVIVAHPTSSPNDLLKIDHRRNHPGNDDVFAGGNIHSGGQQLGRGHQPGSQGFELLKLAEQSFADAALVRSDPANVIGVLLYQILVEIVQRLAHVVGMLLIDAENNRLGETIGLFETAGLSDPGARAARR